MASKNSFETRDARIERMHRDNPGRPIELCTAVVDGIWDKKRELINFRIPDRYAGANIMDLGYLEKEVMDSLERMFAPPSENEVVGIILCGPAGSGKTHAAYAIMKLIAEYNPDMVAFLESYPNIMQQLRHEFSKDYYDDLGSMWDKLNNDSGMYNGVLFIDDLSVGKQTDFEIDKLTMFLDHRMNEFMPFIITTNVPPEKFGEVFGERLASRFAGYCDIIAFEERDQRLPDGSDKQEAL